MYSVFFFILMALNILLLFYALYFTLTGLMGFRYNRDKKKIEKDHRFAIVVAARDEEIVIGNLIESLKHQNYPDEKYDIYVLPNNCTDHTEDVAKEHGAKIIHCTGEIKSKGDALSQGFDAILNGEKQYDAFCVFDADNLVHPEFLNAMNRALCCGTLMAQGFRDSKNPTDSWVSASYSVFYYCMNFFFNRARTAMGLSAMINGTGFMIHTDIIRKHGFKTYTLTEDNEYSIQSVIRGYKIKYIDDAIIYDEHPIKFGDSFRQRKRWSKGVLGCMVRYSGSMLKNGLKGNPACLDIFLFTLGPVVQLLSVVMMALYITLYSFYISTTAFILEELLMATLLCLACSFIFPAIIAIIATMLNGKRPSKLKLAIVGFPVFMISWIPINVCVLFDRNNEWKKIEHNRNITLMEVGKND